MNPQDTAAITLYSDLMTVLQERGFSDLEATEVVMKLTAQAETEVTEELMSKLSDQQLTLLDSLPDNTPPSEIAEKLGFNGDEVDEIRAQKTAQLIQELIPSLNKGIGDNTPQQSQPT